MNNLPIPPELFRLDNVSKHYDHIPALRNISFSLSAPCLAIIKGPNGSGKSTLLQLMASVIRPTAGKIRIFGSTKNPSYRIGYVGHTAMMYNDLTIKENLYYFSALYSLDSADERIHKVLEMMNIENLAHQIFRHLSRGQQQRATIARAILHQPEVLIMDEPFTGLDTESQMSVVRLFQRLHETGISIIMSSHNDQQNSLQHYYQLTLNRGTLTEFTFMH